MNKINDSLLIIGTVKNGGKRLAKNCKKLFKLASFFSKFSILIYENNSTDSTKLILKTLAETYDDFHFISEDLSVAQLHEICTAKDIQGNPCRIEIISHARNIVLQKVKRQFPDFDYILNFDFDVFWFNPHDILRALLRGKKTNPDFDCISVNGLTKRLKYRDAYAFRNVEFPFGPEFLGDYWWETTRHEIQKRYKKGQYIPVYSAFGGCAIYTTEAYLSSWYSAVQNKAYLAVQNELKQQCKDFALLQRAVQEPAAYSKYDKPVICEHVPFHFGLINNGYTKLFIDTSWKILFLD